MIPLLLSRRDSVLGAEVRPRRFWCLVLLIYLWEQLLLPKRTVLPLMTAPPTSLLRVLRKPLAFVSLRQKLLRILVKVAPTAAAGIVTETSELGEWNLNPPFAKVKGEAWPWLAALPGKRGRMLMLTLTLECPFLHPSFLTTVPKTLATLLFKNTETTVGGVLSVFKWRLPFVEVMDTSSKLRHPPIVPTIVIKNSRNRVPLTGAPFGLKRPMLLVTMS